MSGTRSAARGFTLAELAAAVVVLAILALLAVPTYDEVRNRSYDETAKASLLAFSRQAWAEARSKGTGMDGPALQASASQMEVPQSLKASAGLDKMVVIPSDRASSRWGEVSTAVSLDGSRLMAAMRSISGRCVITVVSESAVESTDIDRDTSNTCKAEAPGFVPFSPAGATGGLPAGVPFEDIPAEYVVPEVWMPIPGSGAQEIQDVTVPVEDDPAFTDVLDAATSSAANQGFGSLSGLTSFVSMATSNQYPHRLLITDKDAGAVVMVKQVGPNPDDVEAYIWKAGLSSPEGIEVGPDPSVPASQGRLVLYPVYIGVSDNGGSVLRVDPGTKTATVVASNLGATPTDFAGWACFNPGSTSKAPGACLYATAGDKIHKIDLDTGSASVFATLPSSFGPIRGIAAVDVSGAPGFLVAGQASAVLLKVEDAAGASVVSGTPAPGQGGGGFDLVAPNSSPAFQGTWAAEAAGMRRRWPSDGPSAGVSGAVDVHYHGVPDWLYEITPSELWLSDLSSGSDTLIWSGALSLAWDQELEFETQAEDPTSNGWSRSTKWWQEPSYSVGGGVLRIPPSGAGGATNIYFTRSLAASDLASATFDVSVKVPLVDWNKGWSYKRYGLLEIADGSNAYRLYLRPMSVEDPASGKRYLVGLSEAYRNVRLAKSGSTVRVYVDKQLAFTLSPYESTTNAYLRFGSYMPEVNGTHISYWDYVRYKLGTDYGAQAMSGPPASPFEQYLTFDNGDMSWYPEFNDPDGSGPLFNDGHGWRRAVGASDDPPPSLDAQTGSLAFQTVAAQTFALYAAAVEPVAFEAKLRLSGSANNDETGEEIVGHIRVTDGVNQYVVSFYPTMVLDRGSGQRYGTNLVDRQAHVRIVGAGGVWKLYMDGAYVFTLAPFGTLPAWPSDNMIEFGAMTFLGQAFPDNWAFYSDFAARWDDIGISRGDPGSSGMEFWTPDPWSQTVDFAQDGVWLNSHGWGKSEESQSKWGTVAGGVWTFPVGVYGTTWTLANQVTDRYTFEARMAYSPGSEGQRDNWKMVVDDGTTGRFEIRVMGDGSRIKDMASGALYNVDLSSYRNVRITKNGSTGKLWVDGVLVGSLQQAPTSGYNYAAIGSVYCLPCDPGTVMVDWVKIAPDDLAGTFNGS